MTDQGYETVYVVYHKDEYGFGGDTSISVAVIEENDDFIIGHRAGYGFHPRYERRVVINKNNVAGWEEDRSQMDKIK